jgi:hypothetical protein
MEYGLWMALKPFILRTTSRSGRSRWVRIRSNRSHGVREREAQAADRPPTPRR